MQRLSRILAVVLLFFRLYAFKFDISRIFPKWSISISSKDAYDVRRKVLTGVTATFLLGQGLLPPSSLPYISTQIQIANAATEDVTIETELDNLQEELASLSSEKKGEPIKLLNNIKKSLTAAKQRSRNGASSTGTALDREIAESREVVLTLKAYLDEAERDLFKKNWANLQVYIYTFADQEGNFVTLIDNLFPANDKLDKSAREALAFEAQAVFLALEDLREAALNTKFKPAQRAYAKLLLAYDRFLKAGDLYPKYDPFTSTEVFFKEKDRQALRFDSTSKVQELDTVVIKEGPDMGKGATVILIDGSNAVIKLDAISNTYQEVKYVKLDWIARELEEDRNQNMKGGKKIENKKPPQKLSTS